ncbi:MAG: NAD-dependent DNA ligase LigA [Patescibacteria group bacterium]
MDKIQAKKRIEKLKKTIKKHRYNYHVLDKQEISEEALDSLKKELFDLENKFPEFITKDSPTQRVGGEPLEKFEKYEHFSPMLSMQDGFTEEDLRDWKKRMERHVDQNISGFFCEYKVDGLALELVYRDSVLEIASTRGDGRVGEKVTKNVKTVESIPLKLRSPKEFTDQDKALSSKKEWLEEKKDIVVRGEVYIPHSEFDRINRERKARGEDPYANPRNLAAGTIRQLDPKVVANRNLEFFAYELTANLKTEETVEPFGAETHDLEHKMIRSLGFKTTGEKKCYHLEDVFRFREEAIEKRDSLGYEIDGVAVFVNDNHLFERLGVTGKAPRGTIAYKFPLKKATTKVKDIKIQIGRTGSATPVAVLEPVEIGGVTVTKASLHNEDEIRRLGVKVGDTVVVGRAGDVIPYIVRVLEDMRTGDEEEFVFPNKCPVCGSELVQPEGEVVKRCPSDDCTAKNREYLKYFVSKSAFDIDGLGEKVIEQLMEESLISSPADLFLLEEGDLLPLERFAEKSADNLIKSIEESKEITLSRFIYSLGIKQVGERTAIDLADEFKSLENLQKASKEDLLEINDIGPVVAEEIKKWFSKKDNIKLIEDLKEAGIKIKKPEEKSNQLAEKTFVFTGSLDSLTRKEAKERVLSLGGKPTSSVSSNTDYLVVGENPGSKLKEAKEKNVKILNEEEFKKLI